MSITNEKIQNEADTQKRNELAEKLENLKKQSVNDIGKEMLKKQITVIIRLAKISSNKTKFQEHFARLFNFEKTLFNDNNE